MVAWRREIHLGKLPVDLMMRMVVLVFVVLLNRKRGSGLYGNFLERWYSSLSRAPANHRLCFFLLKRRQHSNVCLFSASSLLSGSQMFCYLTMFVWIISKMLRGQAQQSTMHVQRMTLCYHDSLP